MVGERSQLEFLAVDPEHSHILSLLMCITQRKVFYREILSAFIKLTARNPTMGLVLWIL